MKFNRCWQLLVECLRRRCQHPGKKRREFFGGDSKAFFRTRAVMVRPEAVGTCTWARAASWTLSQLVLPGSPKCSPRFEKFPTVLARSHGPTAAAVDRGCPAARANCCSGSWNGSPLRNQPSLPVGPAAIRAGPDRPSRSTPASGAKGPVRHRPLRSDNRSIRPRHGRFHRLCRWIDGWSRPRG